MTICPNCGTGATTCTDSRPKDDYRRRVYRCHDCGCRWVTAEIPMQEYEALRGLQLEKLDIEGRE